MALDEKPIDDLELKRGLTPEPEQQETTGEKIEEGQRSGAGIGSLFSLLAMAPLGIYSYLNSPARYSAKKLEKEAQKYARNKVREIVKSAQKTKTYTTEEKNTFHQMSLDGYYDGYVRDYQKRADLLAKKSTNQQLLSAIERRNKEDEENNKKIISEQVVKPQPEQLTSAPAPIATMGYEDFNNLPTVDTAPSMEMPNNELSTQSPGASRPSIPSIPGSNTPSGVKPSVPSAPSKTPSIPGRRGIPHPHLPKPRLPGIPNPIQNIRTLAFLLNPTNIIIFFIFGIILSTFLIVLMLGGPGVAIGGEPTQPPVCTEGAVQPLDIAEVKKIINIKYLKNGCGIASDWCGESGEKPTSSQKDHIYATFAKVMGSKKYRDLIGNTPINLYFFTPTTPGTITGGAFNSNTMAWVGFLEFLKKNPDMADHNMIHESGHILRLRNTHLINNSYDRLNLISKDPTCYNGYYSNDHNPGSGGTGDKYIKTYGYRNIYLTPSKPNVPENGGGANSESFAESLSDYVTCKPDTSCDLNDFKHSTPIKFNGVCDATYNWFKTNIFGGDDFFATGNPATCTPPPAPIPNSSNFDALVKGQGRNINALGNRNSFINTAIANIGTRNWNLATNRTYLGQIYDTAVSKNVNPGNAVSYLGN